MLAAAVAASAAAAGPVASVHLPYGTLHGNLLQRSREFLGIPFAAAPHRFEPPEPWTAAYPGGALEATKYTPQCVQQAFGHPAPDSEDCLHLNVYTPAGAKPGAGLPVMLWIHGGGLTTGTAMDPTYNGSALAAAQDVVVVAANYRLNVFGFAPVLRSDGTAVANNGFRDQQQAMRWVQRHIAAFGGDPGSVTIFGQSAGGQSVVTHVLSASSAGLFHRAISESGDSTVLRPLADALNQTAAWAIAVGCSGPSDITCLRRVEPKKMLSVCTTDFSVNPPNCGSGAVIDGAVWAAPLLDVIRAGSFNRVPFILGSNAEDANPFFMGPYSATQPATAADARCALRAAFGAAAEPLLDVYAPVDAPGIDNRGVVASVLSDAMYHCSDHAIAGALTAAGAAPWMYSWRHQPAQNCAFWMSSGARTIPVPGATHAAEIAYVFGLYGWERCNDGVPLPNQTDGHAIPAGDLALARRVSGMWADFARRGRPEAGWPRYTQAETRVLKLGVSTVTALDMESGYRRAQCDAQLAAGIDIAHNGGARANDRVIALIPAIVQCQRQRRRAGGG